MQSELSPSLDKLLKSKLDQRYEKSGGALWTLPKISRELVDFSSNDFLSLSKSADLRHGFLKELTAETKEFSIGSCSTRVLDGNSNYALSLEKDIAAFHNAPNGLLLTSGFDANVSLFGYLPQKGDIIIYDELIHASVHEGMRVSRAKKVLPFAHNSAAAFERILVRCLDEDEKVKSGERNVFVSVEAIYSMDGDAAPLAEIVSLLRRYLPAKNGHLIVDEAHSTGVLGPHGRGVVCELGLESQIFARLHTFGKASACTGAIILCSHLVRLYLINFARPFIYTTSMSFPSLAALRASYAIFKDTRSNEYRQRTFSLMADLHQRLQGLAASSAILANDVAVAGPIAVPKTCPTAAILPIKAPGEKALSLAAHCRDRGYSINAIWAPAVPPGEERVRICVHAGNTQEELDGLFGAIEEWVKHGGKSNKREAGNIKDAKL